MRREKGTGSVVKIRGEYRARLRVAKETLYGPPRPTRDEAEADRLKWSKRPEPPKSHGEIPTLAQWALTQLEGTYGRSLADQTWDTNETFRKRFINPCPISHKRLSQITRADCQTLIDGIRATRKRKIKDGEFETTIELASPRYIRRIAAFISKLFNLAMMDEFIDRNPMKFVTLPAVHDRENRVLTPEEAIKLLNPKTRTDALMLVAIHCGLRRGEIARLQWKHLDTRRNLLVVPGTKNETSRGRVVPLTPDALSALQSQPRRCNFIFSTDAKTPMRPDNITRDVALRKSELGIPAETRLHDLRGSFISLLLEQGTSVRTVMEIVGHKDPRTTLKAYARSNDKAKSEAISGLSAAMKTAQETEQKRDKVTG